MLPRERRAAPGPRPARPGTLTTLSWTMANPEIRGMRKPVRAVHRWLGLWLGTWFALVGLSGAILVFEDEVDTWLNPHLLSDHRPGASLPVHAILERAEGEFPLGHVEKMRPPQAAGEVYRVILR